MADKEPDEVNSAESFEPVESAETDTEALKKPGSDEKEKAEKYLANWQRAEADFTNYKRRAEQDKIDFTSFANSALILYLLPVVDDMERAFASIPPKIEKLQWVEGLKLIHRKFQTILEAQGLKTIEAEGKPFDPNVHEAVSQMDGKEGIVIQEARKGYKIKDKVLRPAQVVVGNGNELGNGDYSQSK